MKVKDLTLDHMPPLAKHGWFLSRVKMTALRTVRLVVSFTAMDRPDAFGLKNLKGTTHIRTGTGYVMEDHSQNQPPPGFPTGNVFFVQTAAHVVFNTEEILKTRVLFFHDEDYDQSGVIRARGVLIDNVQIDTDRCGFWCKADTEKDDKKLSSILSDKEFYVSVQS